MAKPKKLKSKARPVSQQTAALLPHSTVAVPDGKSTAARVDALGPPAKNPSLLGVSVVLFTLWFVYLLVVALGG